MNAIPGVNLTLRLAFFVIAAGGVALNRGLVLSQRPLTGGRIPLFVFDRSHSCVPHLQRTGHQIAILAMTVGIILLVGMTNTTSECITQPTSPAAYRLGGLGTFAGWVLFVFP